MDLKQGKYRLNTCTENQNRSACKPSIAVVNSTYRYSARGTSYVIALATHLECFFCYWTELQTDFDIFLKGKLGSSRKPRISCTTQAGHGDV